MSTVKMSTVEKLVRERNLLAFENEKLKSKIRSYRKWLFTHKEPANYLEKFDKVFSVQREEGKTK
jgi:hypothetical protein